jgi:hypothetical protein
MGTPWKENSRKARGRREPVPTVYSRESVMHARPDANTFGFNGITSSKVVTAGPGLVRPNVAERWLKQFSVYSD